MRIDQMMGIEQNDKIIYIDCPYVNLKPSIMNGSLSESSMNIFNFKEEIWTKYAAVIFWLIFLASSLIDQICNENWQK